MENGLSRKEQGSWGAGRVSKMKRTLGRKKLGDASSENILFLNCNISPFLEMYAVLH